MENLNLLKATELKGIAKELGVKNWWLLKKDELIKGIEELQEITEIKEEQSEEDIKGMVKTHYMNCTQHQMLAALKELLNSGTGDDDIEVIALKEMLGPFLPAELGGEDKPGEEFLITLKELIAAAGIKGTKARRLLRNSEIERPYKRWEWHIVEHKHIIQQVKDLLK